MKSRRNSCHKRDQCLTSGTIPTSGGGQLHLNLVAIRSTQTIHFDQQSSSILLIQTIIPQPSFMSSSASFFINLFFPSIYFFHQPTFSLNLFFPVTYFFPQPTFFMSSLAALISFGHSYFICPSTSKSNASLKT